MMKYSEKKISRLCYGCEALGGKDWGKFDLFALQEGIEKSIDLGLNFFDTADVYGLGLSEKRLSKILGPRRHDFIIGTKGGIQWKETSNSRAKTFKNSSPDYIHECVNKSLKRLKIDVIPVYYIHWPDPKTRISQTFEVLQKLVDQGKIKYLGCSNFNLNQIKEASQVAKISFIQMPVNILNSPLPPSYSEFCKTQSIKIVAYNTLASGLLSGKYNANSTFSKNDRRSRLDDFKKNNLRTVEGELNKLKHKAHKEDLSLAQYSIKIILKDLNIESAIVGIKNKDQAIENLGWLENQSQ